MFLFGLKEVFRSEDFYLFEFVVFGNFGRLFILPGEEAELAPEDPLQGALSGPLLGYQQLGF